MLKLKILWNKYFVERAYFGFQVFCDSVSVGWEAEGGRHRPRNVTPWQRRISSRILKDLHEHTSSSIVPHFDVVT